MHDHIAWASSLNISQDTLQEWWNEAQPNTEPYEFTHWCLLNQKIDTQSYLNWAREHYQLPTLKDEFFEQLPVSELLEKYSHLHMWSPTLQPIAEWDGVLLISGVEPPASLSLTVPHCFLLASAHQLEKNWHQHNSSQESPPLDLSEPSPELAQQANHFDLPELPSIVDINESADAPQSDHNNEPSSALLSPNLQLNHNYKETFHQLSAKFKVGSVVLHLEQEHLVPKSVSSELSPKDRPFHIDLDQASLFRIVYRTKMPYHGPVATSPTNEAFFEWLQLKDIPEHVTACPLLKEGEIFGLLVCCGNSEANSEVALNLAESISQSIIEKFTRQAA